MYANMLLDIAQIKTQIIIQITVSFIDFLVQICLNEKLVKVINEWIWWEMSSMFPVLHIKVKVKHV